MSVDGSVRLPARCPHCSSSKAVRDTVQAGSVRYLCTFCGTFRVSIVTLAVLPQAFPPGTVATFHEDEDGQQWLMPDQTPG